MSTPPLYVSYYTIGNGYEVEAEGLIRSLEMHKLPHQVTGVRPGSEAGDWNWARATQYKAEYIRTMQRLYPDRPLVWLDADARVLQRPRLFDWLRCDLAGHWYRNKEFLSGTVYFAPGKVAREIVERWVIRNSALPHGRCADQRNLYEVLKTRQDVRIVNLPPEYTWIDAGSGNDLSGRAYGCRYPVIVHMQASRRLKNPKR